MLQEEDIAIDLKCQQYICKSYITDCYFAIALPLLMPLSHDFS